MNNLSNYMLFLQEHGRSLSEINPGSDEIALQIDDALQAIELLQEANTAILGGDVLTNESGTLVYTYENWYCDKLSNDTQEKYRIKSYTTAKAYMNDLIKKGYKNRYVVIVVKKHI